MTAPTQKAGGRIAYIGGDGNIYVTRPATGETVAVTADATTAPEGNGRSYHRVAWSPGGTLAYASVTRDNRSTQSTLFVGRPGAVGTKVGESDEAFVIYLHWSPAGCEGGKSCRLVYLIEEQETIALRLVQEIEGRWRSSGIATGRPFYFSWTPDGTQILGHTGGSARLNPAAKMALFRIGDNSPRTLPAAPGSFLAPAWSPDGTEWVGVVRRDQEYVLARVDGDKIQTLAPVPYDAAFAWSPNGQLLAYALREDPGQRHFGPIHLYERDSGETSVLTDPGFHASAFFWSPDSTKLAYINWLAIPEEHWSQWRTVEIESGRDRGFNAFNPSFQMRMWLGSFNQYAQSHRLWSPDSRYLLYADVDRELIKRVWTVDTAAPPGTRATLIGEGTIGVWSWR